MLQKSIRYMDSCLLVVGLAVSFYLQRQGGEVENKITLKFIMTLNWNLNVILTVVVLLLSFTSLSLCTYKQEKFETHVVSRKVALFAVTKKPLAHLAV